MGQFFFGDLLLRLRRLFYYLLNNYFVYRFFDNFLALLLCKINIFGIFDTGDCFRFLLYLEVLKFWSYQTFGWECAGHTSLI